MGIALSPEQGKSYYELFKKADQALYWAKAEGKNNFVFYNEEDEKQVWFDKIKAICEPLGFTSDMKAYRKNPENYKGSVATVSGVIRVAITKKQMSPDLYEICKLLGKDIVLKRIDKVIKLLG